MFTGVRLHDQHMGFDITLRDHSSEFVEGADAFVHDKAMTTFYRTDNDRHAVDCWSVATAAIRTDEILMIRRRVDEATTDVRHLMSV